MRKTYDAVCPLRKYPGLLGETDLEPFTQHRKPANYWAAPMEFVKKEVRPV